MPSYVSRINIPAYDSCNNGLVVAFKVTLYPNSAFIINSIGNIAIALQNNFQRNIEIMSSLKKSWECLEKTAYVIECVHPQFIVKDAKSSSMAFSIALINGLRAINHLPQVLGFSGTGILRIDGSFDSSHLEEKKYFAAKKEEKELNRFITPYQCKHLFDLEKLIYEYY